MSAFNWIDANPAPWEQMLDKAVRDNANLEEIKTAIAERITENGFRESGCSQIDAIASGLRDDVLERIDFERDLCGEASDDQDDGRNEETEELRAEYYADQLAPHLRRAV